LIRSNFDDTHSKILDCGRKHFLKNGFEKASLRDICKDAGVTTGAFYRHFNDKNELFELEENLIPVMLIALGKKEKDARYFQG